MAIRKLRVCRDIRMFLPNVAGENLFTPGGNSPEHFLISWSPAQSGKISFFTLNVNHSVWRERKMPAGNALSVHTPTIPKRETRKKAFPLEPRLKTFRTPGDARNARSSRGRKVCLWSGRTEAGNTESSPAGPPKRKKSLPRTGRTARYTVRGTTMSLICSPVA
jgi:hypothetical protein